MRPLRRKPRRDRTASRLSQMPRGSSRHETQDADARREEARLLGGRVETEEAEWEFVGLGRVGVFKACVWFEE